MVRDLVFCGRHHPHAGQRRAERIVFARFVGEDASLRMECCMPDFTVIEGGGPEGRDRIRVEQEFEFALREAAANMLRIIRGAGKNSVT